jgi:hypothetical protein
MELRANAGATTPGRTDGYGSAAERQLALGFRSLLSASLSLGLALHLRLPPDTPSRAHLPPPPHGALVSSVWVSSIRIPEDSHLLFHAHAGRTLCGGRALTFNGLRLVECALGLRLQRAQTLARLRTPPSPQILPHPSTALRFTRDRPSPWGARHPETLHGHTHRERHPCPFRDDIDDHIAKREPDNRSSRGLTPHSSIGIGIAN